MKAPKFWEDDGLTSKLLSPLSGIYAKQTAKRVKQKGYKAKIPVICVGNLVAGGAGKTPTAIEIASWFQEKDKQVHFLSRGYKGSEENPCKVDCKDAERFGDEAVMLSEYATSWVGAARDETAKLAESEGAEILIMDDGFQNPLLQKDFSLLVVDGVYGFGNGKVIPAGPLRENVKDGLKRADAVLVIGEEKAKLPKFEIPKFNAKIKIEYNEILKQEEIVAFCGLGRPQKFFDSLKTEELNVVGEMPFPDHHQYSEADLKQVFAEATKHNAVVVTTQKDYVKIPDQLKMLVQLVKSELVIEDLAKLKRQVFKGLGLKA